MRRRRSPHRLRRTSFIGVVLLLLLSLGYAFSPAKAVWSVRELSNPAKLATLGKRGANPRLNKIVYWLWEARERGMSPEAAARVAQTLNGVIGERARLVEESLVRNVRIADDLGLYTRENRERLRRGGAAIVSTGPHTGQQAEVDHIVPVSLAPEIGNELANLELLPERLNQQKSDRVGERELGHAEALHRAGLLSNESLARVRRAAD